jgi:hypothetical protein
LDVKKYGRWYNTNAGVGIVGQTGGDTGEKRKGLPLSLLAVFAVLVVLGVVFGGKSLAKSAVAFIGGRKKSAAPIASAMRPVGDSVAALAAGNSSSSVTPPSRHIVPVPAEAVSKAPEESPVYFTGIFQIGGETFVSFSDGSQLRSSGGDILAASSQLVVYRVGPLVRTARRAPALVHTNDVVTPEPLKGSAVIADVNIQPVYRVKVGKWN